MCCDSCLLQTNDAQAPPSRACDLFELRYNPVHWFLPVFIRTNSWCTGRTSRLKMTAIFLFYLNICMCVYMYNIFSHLIHIMYKALH